MKKNWNNPELKNLELIATEADYIIAEQVDNGATADIKPDGIMGGFLGWRWKCTCCNKTSTNWYCSKEDAVEAGKKDHPEHANGCSA